MSNVSELFDTEDDQKLLFSTLRMLGVKHATVTFSGSGDSGNIDSVECFSEDKVMVPVDNVLLQWSESTEKFDTSTQKWIKTTQRDQKPVNKILEQLADRALDVKGYDWYNNEGGQGTFDIDFTTSPPTLNLYVGINEMTTHDYTDLFEFDDTWK